MMTIKQKKTIKNFKLNNKESHLQFSFECPIVDEFNAVVELLINFVCILNLFVV